MADDAVTVEQLQAELQQAREREAVTAKRAARAEAALAQAHEQQAATTEVLRVIASSPSDRPTVLEAIASAASRLTGSDGAAVVQAFGSRYRPVVNVGRAVAAHEAAVATVGRPIQGLPIIRTTIAGRALLDKRPIHVPDMAAAVKSEFPDSEPTYTVMGIRSQAAIPLLRDGEAIGVLGVHRYETRPFADREIALLETFADQAVIAIENARLFSELEQRNVELQESNRQVSEALEQQTALGEVLRVIASAPADLDRVLQEIVETAAKWCIHQVHATRGSRASPV